MFDPFIPVSLRGRRYGLLILLRRGQRQKEVHMTELKRKPILVAIDHGYGVRP